MPLDLSVLSGNINRFQSVTKILQTLHLANLASGMSGTPGDLEDSLMSELASYGGIVPVSYKEAQAYARKTYLSMCNSKTEETAESNILGYCDSMATSFSELVDDKLDELRLFTKRPDLTSADVTYENMQDFLLNEIIETKLSSLSDLTAKGILSIWNEDSKLNHGDPSFLVSSIKDEDITSPTRELDLELCSQEVFDKKVEHGLSVRGGKPFAILVGGGIHWFSLVIDPKAKKFFIADSSLQMSESEDPLDDYDPLGTETTVPDSRLHTYLKSSPLLIGYEDATQIPSVKQQHDSTTCGFWTLTNLSYCVNKDLDSITLPSTQVGEAGFAKMQLSLLKDAARHYIETPAVQKLGADILSVPTEVIKGSKTDQSRKTRRDRTRTV